MDGRLAEAILTVITHAVARHRGVRTITDRSTAFSHLHTAEEAGLTAALLPDASGSPDRPTPPIRADDVRHAYAALAVRAVLPADLDRVPAPAIVRARKTLRSEFDAFTAHLDDAMQRFEHIARSSDPAHLDADLHELFDTRLDSARQELETGLTRLGLRPVSAVLGARDLALPAGAAALLHSTGASTAVTTAAGAAIMFTSAARAAVVESRTQRHTAPGYLLGLREELTPKGVIDRFRRAARHRRG